MKWIRELTDDFHPAPCVVLLIGGASIVAVIGHAVGLWKLSQHDESRSRLERIEAKVDALLQR